MEVKVNTKTKTYLFTDIMKWTYFQDPETEDVFMRVPESKSRAIGIYTGEPYHFNAVDVEGSYRLFDMEHKVIPLQPKLLEFDE